MSNAVIVVRRSQPLAFTIQHKIGDFTNFISKAIAILLEFCNDVLMGSGGETEDRVVLVQLVTTG